MSTQKIKLVLVKSYANEAMFGDTFSQDVEIDLPDGFDQVHLLAARSYTPKDLDPQLISSNVDSAILKYEDENHILGQLLTIADATFSDKDQREAFKSLTRNTVYEFFRRVRSNAEKTVDANERRDARRAENPSLPRNSK